MNVYKIGVSLSMTSNAAQVLHALSSQLLHVHSHVNQLQGSLNRVKVAIGGAFAVAGGVAALKTMGGMIDRGNELVKVQQDMAQAGVKNADIQEAYAKAWEMTGKYQNMSAVEVMKLINDGRMTFGDQHAATHHVEDFVQAQGFLKSYQDGKHAAHGEGLMREINAAMKSSEIAGKISPHEMQDHVKQLTAMKVAYGEGVKVTEYLTSQRAAGVAMRNADDQFRYGIFPALVQENGSGAGVMLMTAFNKIAAGTGNREKSLAQMRDIGLLVDGKYRNTKKGAELTAPDGIKGSRDFAANPARWVIETFKPLLDKKTTDPIQQAQMVSAMFPDRNAAKLITEVLQQFTKFSKDAHLMREARDALNLPSYNAKSWIAQKQAFQTQWDNFIAALGAPMVGQATESLSRINKAIAGFGQWAALSENASTIQAIGVGIAGLSATLVGAGAAAIIAALGPAGWLVLGVGALATAIAAARAYFQGNDPVMRTDPQVKSVRNDAIHGDERFKPMTRIDEITAEWEQAKNRVLAAIGMQGLPEQIASAIEGVGRQLSSAIQNLPSMVSGAISSAIGGIASLFTGAIAKIGSMISGLGNAKVDPSGQRLGQTEPPRARENGGAPALNPSIKRGAELIPPPRGMGTVQVASSIHLDGRVVGRQVTRHQVADANTRNGTGLFDDNSLKTPVGYSGPLIA